MQIKTYLAERLENLFTEIKPYSNKTITLNCPYFSKQNEQVAFFMAEVEQTAEKLATQTEVVYAEYYAERLLRQLDALTQSVEKMRAKKEAPQFHSSFRFSPNVHRLPPHKRLEEYRNALRALNEKISWLMEQHYLEDEVNKKQQWQAQISETEYRKMKCVDAIEELEQQLLFQKN